MSTTKEEIVAEKVHRMVIWDEPREKVFETMEVNGLVGEAAERLYKQALAERISIIKGLCWRKVLVGGAWLGAAASVFCLFRFGVEAITLRLLWIVFAVGIYGAWKCLDGVMGVLTASRKRGSLADEE